MIHHGDLFDVLPTLEAESIDACVTDPPYGIAFMGKSWDDFDSLEFEKWSQRWGLEVFRVLKPGAYLVVCGAPRSYHRMACGLEDSGFVIRDKFAWLFGSGFPKNHNLGDGKGTALKPAHEPIALAWKPFKGTIKACHSQHGTAALNIEACRIGTDAGWSYPNGRGGDGWHGRESLAQNLKVPMAADAGRWPANVVLDEIAAAALDEQSGELTSGGFPPSRYPDQARSVYGTFKWRTGNEVADGVGPSIGGASRFYYVAKPSRAERDMGCYDLPASTGGEATDHTDGSAGLDNPRAGAGRMGGARNIHPTVKPIALMRWLVRLVTPVNGVVLDPFLGSGTTAMAAVLEQRRWVGIEREAEYLEIAKRRIHAVAPLFSDGAA